MWDSTAELESSFSTLRRFNAALSEENKDSFLKVFADAGEPKEIAAVVHQHGGAVRYEPRPFGLKIIRMYRVLYGGAACNGRTCCLPRRLMAPRVRKTGLAAFERRRAAERLQLEKPGATAVAAGSEQATATEEIAKQVDDAAAAAKSERQVNLLATVKKQLSEKQQQFRMWPGESAAVLKKLRDKEREVCKSAALLAKMESRELSQQIRQLHGNVTVVIMGLDQHAKQRAKKQLCRRDLGGRVLGTADLLNAIIDKSFFQDMLTHLIYLCIDNETFRVMSTLPEVNDTDGRTDQQAKQAGMIIASRLLGGYIASSNWLEKVLKEDTVSAPILQLQPAYTCAYQFYLSEKLRDEMKQLISAMYYGVQESSAGPRANWVLREKKNFLTRGCKWQSPKNAWFCSVIPCGCRARGSPVHTPHQDPGSLTRRRGRGSPS